MLRVKTGVTPKHLIIAAAVANTASALELNVTITSGTDGRHMKGSRHYSSEALDVRSKNFPDHNSKMLFLSHVLARLGHNYEGMLEFRGKPQEHFHIEFQPRTTRLRR